MVQKRHFSLPVSASKAARKPRTPSSPPEVADQHLVFHDQRAPGCAVVLVAGGVGHIPDQVAGPRIEAEQVRVVRLHINARAQYGHAAIVMWPGSSISPCVTARVWCHSTLAGLASSAYASFALVTNMTPGHDDGSHFERADRTRVKNPLGRQSATLRRRDLRQAAVAARRCNRRCRKSQLPATGFWSKSFAER